VDAGIDFIESHKNKPWFLWLATTVPHNPYIQDPEFHYTNINPPPGWPSGQTFVAKSMPKYYSTISMLDREIGRMLNRLEELGLSRNTFVFFTGDNGYMFNSHGIEGKEVWYEEAARVPGVVRWPAMIPSGKKISSLLSSADLLPTISDLAGTTADPKLEGKSMLPALISGKPTRTEIFSEVGDPPLWSMVKNERWKFVLIHRPKKFPQLNGKTSLLFDMKDDPHEQNDLSSSKEHAAHLKQMKGLLEDWYRKTSNIEQKPRVLDIPAQKD
jgi:arylsulfatase A-like enzyme